MEQENLEQSTFPSLPNLWKSYLSKTKKKKQFQQKSSNDASKIDAGVIQKLQNMHECTLLS